MICLIFCEKLFEKSWKKKIAAGKNSYFRKASYRIHANVGREWKRPWINDIP